MSIVQSLVIRHIAENAENGSTFSPVREHAVRQVKELLALARQLEAHCEAMSAYSKGHSSACNCGACAYLKFREGMK